MTSMSESLNIAPPGGAKPGPEKKRQYWRRGRLPAHRKAAMEQKAEALIRGGMSIADTGRATGLAMRTLHSMAKQGGWLASLSTPDDLALAKSVDWVAEGEVWRAREWGYWRDEVERVLQHPDLAERVELLSRVCREMRTVLGTSLPSAPTVQVAVFAPPASKQ